MKETRECVCTFQWVQEGRDGYKTGYGWYKRGRVGTRGGEVEVILT